MGSEKETGHRFGNGATKKGEGSSLVPNICRFDLS